jgi:hypothetical protein
MKTALVTAAAALLVLVGCTSTDTGTTSPPPPGQTTGAGGAGSSTPGSSTASTSGTAPSTSTTATADPAPTAVPTAFTDINQTIDDGDLKDAVTVKRIARQLPWPVGYKASAQAYELVAVEMTWTPSKSFTIPIRRQDFSINTGSQFPNQPDTVADATLKAATWNLLPDQVATGDAVTGWVVFKVDPRNTPSMALDYARPATQVSGGGTSFPAKTFSIRLVG